MRSGALEKSGKRIYAVPATAIAELITTHWYEFLQRGRQETVAGWIEGYRAFWQLNLTNLKRHLERK